LHWDNQLSATAVRASRVATLLQAEMTDPKSYPRWSLDLITILGIIVSVAFWAGGVVNSHSALQIAAILLLGLSLIRWFLKDLEKSQVLSDFYYDLCECCEELESLESNLSTYLTELDQRTSRYFHCVTTSKVTSYYILGQILGELGKFNQQLAEVLARKSWQRCNAAFNLLSSDLSVADGNLLSSGQMHDLPLIRVTPTVAELTEMLEEGLREIEEDIEEFQKRHSFNDSQINIDADE